MSKDSQELIKNDKLLEILNHENFKKKFESFDYNLINYLSKEETISKLINLLIRKNTEKVIKKK